jgi:hypothetical protein
MDKSNYRKKAEEDSTTLRHLVHSLDESEKEMEEFYMKNKVDEFNKAKKTILQLNKKISEILK